MFLLPGFLHLGLMCHREIKVCEGCISPLNWGRRIVDRDCSGKENWHLNSVLFSGRSVLGKNMHGSWGEGLCPVITLLPPSVIAHWGTHNISEGKNSTYRQCGPGQVEVRQWQEHPPPLSFPCLSAVSLPGGLLVCCLISLTKGLSSSCKPDLTYI